MNADVKQVSRLGHNDLLHPTTTKDKLHRIKIDKKEKEKAVDMQKIKYIFIIVLTSVLEKTTTFTVGLAVGQQYLGSTFA